MLWIGLQFVIVVFPDHTHLVFLGIFTISSKLLLASVVFTVHSKFIIISNFAYNTIELLFLLYNNMLNHTVLTLNIIVAWTVYLLYCDIYERVPFSSSGHGAHTNFLYYFWSIVQWILLKSIWL